jgi:hypothetical protein
MDSVDDKKDTIESLIQDLNKQALVTKSHEVIEFELNDKKQIVLKKQIQQTTNDQLETAK